MRRLLLAVVLWLPACGDEDDTPDGGMHTGATPDDFACGELTCTGLQYCDVTIAGQPDTAGNAVISYACLDAPAGCEGPPTCACVVCDGDCVRDAGVTCTTALP